MTHALVAPRLVWRMLRAFMLTIIHLLSALFFLERGPNGSEATWQDNKDTNVFPRADAWNMIWACRLCSSQNIFPSTLPDQKQGRQKKKQQQLQNKTFPLDFFFSIWGKCIYSKCYLDLSLLWWKSKYPFVWARFNSLPKTHLMDSKSCRCRFVAKGKETKQIAADNRSELNEAAKCMRDYFSLECWQSIINVSPVWCTMGLRVVAAAGPVY